MGMGLPINPCVCSRVVDLGEVFLVRLTVAPDEYLALVSDWLADVLVVLALHV